MSIFGYCNQFIQFWYLVIEMGCVSWNKAVCTFFVKSDANQRSFPEDFVKNKSNPLKTLEVLCKKV